MKFYRYIEVSYESGVQLDVKEYKLVRETPKGYWIIDDLWHYDEESVETYKKWVSKTARKRWAYPTIEEALTSFKARKNRQIRILTHQLKGAKVALKLAENGDFCTISGPGTVFKPTGTYKEEVMENVNSR